MYLFLSILTVLITIYLVTLLIVYIAHHNKFKNRFTPNPLITYYNEKEFDCNRRDASFKIKNDTIKGCFITPNKKYDDTKIIIYCHGIDSPKEAYMQDISVIANGGFEVFGFDYIGVNESEGKSVGGLASGLKSVDYAIKFIHNEYPDKDIYVIGHSWGAWNTINSVKYNPFVKKICAIAPFITINSVAQLLMPPKFKFLALNTEIVEGFKYGKYAFANSIKSLNQYEGKALIIHSRDDGMVPFNASTKILEDKFKDNERYKFLILDGKKHNPQYTYESLRKTNEIFMKLKELKEEEMISFMKGVNFHELGQLDMDIMNQIIDFFKEK